MQARAIIENVSPEVDQGKRYAKAIIGEILTVECDLFTDGHDRVAGRLQFRHSSQKKWQEVPLEHQGNDRWTAQLPVDQMGLYTYRIEGWVDYPLNWQHGIQRKIEDQQEVKSELSEGILFLNPLLKKKLKKADKDYLKKLISLFEDPDSYEEAVQEAQSERLYHLFDAHPVRDFSIHYKELQVFADRKKAGFSTWYELFPRSTSLEKGKHGTFKDVERLIPRIAEMGFDTLYMPPVHPIGEVNRKGKNNSTTAQEGDVGSPWGIGSRHGGHKALHPELGDLDDFKTLIATAKDHEIELAMDFALQCAPDHPYVTSNPQWFRWRPDGTVQYAENPPKKYQDILPIYFECEDWKNLWDELLSVALFWAEQGIRVFRVDNPHTKPYRFWEWMIAKVKEQYPDFLFLSEAFTRPKVMQQLAKLGFTWSYTYYTWRNTKAELIEYMNELTQTESRYEFRPNFWPQTPDINPWDLQSPVEATYLIRYALAATLSSNYGIYGPVYEQMVHDAIPGKEEYLDSEKYEVRHWDWDKNNKIREVISRVNRIRRDHEALQWTNNIEFCEIENENILAFFKQSPDRKDNLLIVANLDPYYTQSGWVQLPLKSLKPGANGYYIMKDLVTGISYNWHEEWNYVELNPHGLPFHIFHIISA